MTIVLDRIPDDNIIRNMLDKLDNTSAKYHDCLIVSDNKVSKEATQALIEFIQYRDDFIAIGLKLTFMGVITFNTGWMMECYCNRVTDRLQIFNNDFYNTSDKEQIRKLMEWRNGLNDD
jgi:hypothetical protein